MLGLVDEPLVADTVEGAASPWMIQSDELVHPALSAASLMIAL
jgi:hypothetical protein